MNKYKADKNGYYGRFGGRYVPEILIPALDELEECFNDSIRDTAFLDELEGLYKNLIGRPTPLYHCKNLSNHIGGAQIVLKNEGLAHTGAHKINHCVGQALLAKEMGKKKIVAETGAGQHGVATSSVCANMNLECQIFMGEIDYGRQRPNVFKMEIYGAKVLPVSSGGKRLKDAVNESIKYWITNVRDTHFLLGSCLGPHPFPEINRFFQSVISREIKLQMNQQFGKLPEYVVACVGGGSNAAGAFNEFLDHEEVKLIGVEAGGHGLKSGKHAIRMQSNNIGVVEGYKSYWLLNRNGQVEDTHSISAGLDYAGIGPLHAHLRDLHRAEYLSATDDEALSALKLLAQTEGILPALESAHGLHQGIQIAKDLPQSKVVVVNLSGRADKDLFILAKELKDKEFVQFLKGYINENDF